MLTAIATRLRRVTNGRPWIPEIDGLRFLAIAGVVLFHCFGELVTRSGRAVPVEPRYWLLGEALHHGDRGVRLFFVISGLVLGLPFARQFLAGGRPVRLSGYYLRRLTRLEPPYLLSIVISVAAFAAWNHGVSGMFLQHALVNAFYLNNLVYGDISIVNFVTWTLEVEVQFYLLAPLFMQIYRVPGKLPRRMAFFAVMLLLMPVEAASFGNMRASLSILKYADYFLAGVFAADLFVTELPLWKESFAWDAAALLCGIWIAFGGESLANHMLFPFGMAVLCFAAMRGRVTRRLLSTEWIAVTGGMCYSIYLLHMIVIAAAFKVTKHLLLAHVDFLANYLLQTSLLLAAVAAASICFYLLIERPCMDPQWPLKLRRWFSARTHAAEPATRS